MSKETKTRVANAFRAMKGIGISEDKVKPVLRYLLKLYDKNWELIEEENYRALADAIFEREEAEVSVVAEQEAFLVPVGVFCATTPYFISKLFVLIYISARICPLNLIFNQSAELLFLLSVRQKSVQRRLWTMQYVTHLTIVLSKSVS